MADPRERPTAAGPPTALPPVGARVLAFLAVIVAGACGGLIGYSLVRLQCDGACATPSGLGFLTGAVVAAGGVAVVVALVLRAMSEWRAGGIRRGQPERESRRNPSA